MVIVEPGKITIETTGQVGKVLADTVLSIIGIYGRVMSVREIAEQVESDTLTETHKLLVEKGEGC